MHCGFSCSENVLALEIDVNVSWHTLKHPNKIDTVQRFHPPHTGKTRSHTSIKLVEQCVQPYLRIRCSRETTQLSATPRQIPKTIAEQNRTEQNGPEQNRTLTFHSLQCTLSARAASAQHQPLAPFPLPSSRPIRPHPAPLREHVLCASD